MGSRSPSSSSLAAEPEYGYRLIQRARKPSFDFSKLVRVTGGTAEQPLQSESPAISSMRAVQNLDQIT